VRRHFLSTDWSNLELAFNVRFRLIFEDQVIRFFSFGFLVVALAPKMASRYRGVFTVFHSSFDQMQSDLTGFYWVLPNFGLGRVIFLVGKRVVFLFFLEDEFCSAV